MEDYELTPKAHTLAEEKGQQISAMPSYQDFMQSSILGGLTSAFKPNTTRKQNSQHTNIGPKVFRQTRRGDSTADLLGKMYNFMSLLEEYTEIENKKDVKYRKEFTKRKDRQLDELIDALEEKTPQEKKSKFASKSKMAALSALALGGILLSKDVFAKFNLDSIFTGSTKAGRLDTVKSKEMYNYLTKEKGLTHEQSIGILANIQAESSFMPGVIGDDGTSGGLFQHHNERFEEMKKFVGKDWQTDWKKQIDFALQEKEGKEYTNKQFSSNEESTKAFTKGFEKPKDAEEQAQKRVANIPDIEKSIKDAPTTSNLVSPIKGSPKISSGTGERVNPITGKIQRHKGIDIVASTGTPVMAANSGTIKSGSDSERGNFVEITGDDGTVTKYFHLNKIQVPEGRVEAGQVIGEVGSTGRSTGPHLHFEVLQKDSSGKLSYVENLGDILKPVPEMQKVSKTTQKSGQSINVSTTNIQHGSITVAQNIIPKSNRPVIMDIQYGIA
jgi:murein DD-endopeptidase MepM/ murein hydrolase activator NlpD